MTCLIVLILKNIFQLKQLKMSRQWFILLCLKPDHMRAVVYSSSDYTVLIFF